MSKHPQTDPRYHDVTAVNCEQRYKFTAKQLLPKKLQRITGRVCPACHVKQYPQPKGAKA